MSDGICNWKNILLVISTATPYIHTAVYFWNSPNRCLCLAGKYPGPILIHQVIEIRPIKFHSSVIYSSSGSNQILYRVTFLWPWKVTFSNIWIWTCYVIYRPIKWWLINEQTTPQTFGSEMLIGWRQMSPERGTWLDLLGVYRRGAELAVLMLIRLIQVVSFIQTGLLLRIAVFCQQ